VQLASRGRQEGIYVQGVLMASPVDSDYPRAPTCTEEVGGAGETVVARKLTAS